MIVRSAKNVTVELEFFGVVTNLNVQPLFHRGPLREHCDELGGRVLGTGVTGVTGSLRDAGSCSDVA